MMWDIAGIQQYVYGKKQGEDEEKIYLVDTDLKYAGLPDEFVFSYLRELVAFISMTEKKLETNFSEERTQVINFLKEIKPEDARLQKSNIVIINRILGINN